MLKTGNLGNKYEKFDYQVILGLPETLVSVKYCVLISAVYKGCMCFVLQIVENVLIIGLLFIELSSN